MEQIENKIVWFEILDNSIRPPWLNEKKIRIFIPKILNNKADGKILANFIYQNKSFPAILKAKNKIIYNFNLKETFKTILLEKFFKKKIPIYTKFPFHYHKIPFRDLIAKTLNLLQYHSYTPYYPNWPIDKSIELLKYIQAKLKAQKQKIPWPKNKKFAVALTHDVDTGKGLSHIEDLAKIEESFNLTSCWNIVGNYYPINHLLLSSLVSRGHEIGSHGYNHDNKLAFLPKDEIRQRFKIALENLKDYDVKGFRSPSLLRTDALYEVLPEFFLYDSSRPDTEMFSPINFYNGCATIFPYKHNNLIELPLTIPQDAHLILLNYRPKRILEFWIKKFEFIKKLNGLAVVNTHPETHFSANKKMMPIYKEFLEIIKKETKAWIVNPIEIANYTKKTLKEL